MHTLFGNSYKDRRVLITGHTGFKGSWLMYWLESMGAITLGYSRMSITDPNHFSVLKLSGESIIGEIADREKLIAAVHAFKPEIVFHLAAQPLVRESYKNPFETYMTNVMGTLAMCEASRVAGSVKAIVSITTDKVYENKEWVWAYRENDALGGYDPYSSSKACAEIALASMRNSYFNLADFGKTHEVLLATVRAGNVIGGGDWSADRLIPDIMKAAALGTTVAIRSPRATRPWQHVLDCLSGYLLVGKYLLDKNVHMAQSFNFGPARESNLPVIEVTKRVIEHWPKACFSIEENTQQPHEANLLMLDCAKAHRELSWEPIWDVNKAFERTVRWYRNFYEEKRVETSADLNEYINNAKVKEAVWVK